MAGPAAPPTGPAGAKKKRQQQLMLAGGAIAVILFVFLGRGNSSQGAAAAPSPDQLPAGSSQIPPSTFADNGAQAGALGDSVTSGLSGVSTALSGQADSFDQLASSIQGYQAQAAPAGDTTPGQDLFNAFGAGVSFGQKVGQPANSTPAPKKAAKKKKTVHKPAQRKRAPHPKATHKGATHHKTVGHPAKRPARPKPRPKPRHR